MGLIFSNLNTKLIVIEQTVIEYVLSARQYAKSTCLEKCEFVYIHDRRVFFLMFLKCFISGALVCRLRVIYDLLFYFIVIIIVLNLIFGVIIDTFADLRSENRKKKKF